MNLPREIIENILLKCDGKTLLSAHEVDPGWCKIVSYLSQKTKLWEWCCKEEIPHKELLDYIEKYSSDDSERWLNIYVNWISWQDINASIRCETILCPIEITRISCITALGKYIATGTESGRIKIFTENWKLIYAARHQAVKVTCISFMNETDGCEILSSDLRFAVAYPRALIIDQCGDMSENQLIIPDVKTHSVHKNYICYEQLGGRITIARLIDFDGVRQLEEIWFDRIYSPNNISCVNIWNGVCTLLVNKEVKIVNYLKMDLIPVSNLEIKTKIKFTVPDQIVDYIFQILRDDIIISRWKHNCFEKDEFIEFFILGPGDEYSKKLFNTWEVLDAFITCIFVYGNTLILGVDIGNVYFYHITSWKHFDIRNYQRKIILGRHPIISIDVKEVKNERTFFISSNFSIHKVVGFTNGCF